MGSGLYMTMLAGPVVAVPPPKPLTDALTSAEVTVSDTGTSGFQLTFTLANSSPLQILFLLAGGDSQQVAGPLGRTGASRCEAAFGE